MINRITVLCLLFCTVKVFSQSNNQTSSPYSLFGLGRLNEAGVGKTNALGKSGIAFSSETELNNLNPASYAGIFKNSFLFDIGIKGEKNNMATIDDQKSTTTYNFSNISMAIGLTDKSAIGFSLSPYSDVGYFLQGVTGSVEGNADTYSSDIEGSGGLNNAMLTYGRKFNNKLNLGVNASYYFGNIEETEVITINNDYLSINEKSYYRGIRFGVGAQYKVNEKLDIASVINLPVSLSGKQDRLVNKIVDYYSAEVEDIGGRSISSFKLPLEFTIGAKYVFADVLTVNADYKRSFWNATDMEDNLGSFTDQDFIGVGFEYFRNKNRYSYFDQVRYRLGFNADNGYLEVGGARVKNVAFTSGIGLPIRGSGNSFLNLSYSYGQRGVITTTLTEEKYHLFTVNISLSDIWFKKRKYD
ncbi:hypothetical protein E0W72_01375 [Flavobacterium arcticum]|uniref:hypothetical protein n=1 Tax=Flavobacterium arcticum TaxID=1784713 RepID=UPI000FDCE516|nr:hypothetical protein [Flavobacterium arcticum]KAF2513103.1 hypothetical protein E0W72_01375 [Flavobacterium arcticum]